MLTCSWCGHNLHGNGPCTKTITTWAPPERWPKIMPQKTDKRVVITAPCPCAAHERRVA